MICIRSQSSRLHTRSGPNRGAPSCEPASCRQTQIGINPEPIFQEVSRQQSHWMNARGEVAAFFRVEVDRARHSLETEQECVFEPFWQWRIDCAEDALRAAEERAKEERGE